MTGPFFSSVLTADRETAKELHTALEREAARVGDAALRSVAAELGRRDLFYLLTRLLGRKDLDSDWHYSRMREVQASPDNMLDLWAREHGKSSIITFGQTIRDILNDPELTVGIFSHTRPVAKDFLGQIKYEFETNARLKSLYPDVLWQNPRREAPVWSLDKGIAVKRRKNPKEATVEAWGLVDGQPTGKHFSLLIYDDVVTRESVSTPEMMQKVTDAWALSLNLGARGGRRRVIGTRYHFNDTYKVILERGAATARVHPATEDGKPDGVPVLLSRAALEEKRRSMGARVFGCQMLLNPAADSLFGFQEKHLRFWSVPRPSECSYLNRYITVDPAGSRKQGSDYTVMLVLGLGPDRNWYLLDGIRDRLSLKGRAEALFRLHRLHRPLAVGYEQYGMQADIEFILSEQERLNYRFPVTALGGRTAKNERILALGPYFEEGRIFLPHHAPFIDAEGKARDLSRELQEEYLAFPAAAHDDMLDCMARILEPALGTVFPDAGEEGGAERLRAEVEYKLF